MDSQAGPISRLIAELSRLPGIGQRTAQRLAFHLLRAEDDEALEPAPTHGGRRALESPKRCSKCARSERGVGYGASSGISSMGGGGGRLAR